MNGRRLCVCGAVIILSVTSGVAFGADQRLVNAVMSGDNDTARFLLRRHVDVNIAQDDGATALAWAVHRDDLEITTLLIRAGANPNAANAYGVTPLYLASLNRNPAMVAKLIQAGANPNVALPSGETPLMTASHTGNVDVVKLLLGRAAEVNATTKLGQTALMWAIAENHPEVARELIAHGANVSARSKSGFTVLMFAAQQGDLDSARMLVAAGANVNDSTPEDGSALVVASGSGHEAFAAFLLSKDADPNAANRYGITALHYAILRGLSLGAGVEWDSSAAYLFRPNMLGLVKMLLAHGANPNARIIKVPPLPGARKLGLAPSGPVISVSGATPFLLAAASYDANLMRTLLAAGADPHLTTQEQTTALIFAAGLAAGLGKLPRRTNEDDRRALEAVKLAVELGDDVNAANRDGETALHGAAYVGSDAIVQFLVDKGANVNVKDNSGQTPWTIAQQVFPPTLLDDNLRPQFANPSTAALLVKLGATPFLPVVPTPSLSSK